MKSSAGKNWLVAAVVLAVLCLGDIPAPRMQPAFGQPAAPQPVAAAAKPVRKGKAALAVMPFQTTAEIRRVHGADLGMLYDSLVRIFVKSNKFDVLERTKIEQVIDENQFSTSLVGNPANASHFGKLTGAQYLVVGDIRDLSVSTRREKIPYVHEWKCTETARLRLEVRVVQTETGRIVSADTAGYGKNTPVRTVPCGRTRQATLDDLMNNVAAELVAKVVDSVYPLTVVRVAGEELMLNRGEGSTFRDGSVLDCFVSGEAITDPDTGDLLGYAETPVGSITITEVMPKLSKAQPNDGATIPVRSVCRRPAHPPTPAPARKARPPKVNW